MPLGPSRFRAGTTFGDYVLEELLGVGGFAEVWKARNPHMRNQAPVALKFITNQEAQQRLAKHEINVLNKVQANGRIEGVIELRGTQITANPPCLIFEYVEGCDLSAVIRQRGETPWQSGGRVRCESCVTIVESGASATGRGRASRHQAGRMCWYVQTVHSLWRISVSVGWQ
jgi:serine/threonine protein kinase